MDTEEDEAIKKEWATYRQEQQAMRLSKVGAERITHLRNQLNEEPATKQRELVVAVDGGYTNRTVFREKPEGATLIGRIRKDAHLFDAPAQTDGARGRRRLYGEALRTPEQLRQDEKHCVAVGQSACRGQGLGL